MIVVQDALPSEDSISVFLEQLTLVGAKLFSDEEHIACGLMLRRTDGQPLFCSASPVITEMYEVLAAQHAQGEGPAPQALSTSKLQVADNTGDPSHPPFFGLPASRGFASILSVPLIIGAGSSAALNFYARPVAFFSPKRQRVASVFAEQASTSIELRLRLTQYQNLTEHMRSAMQSRTSIDMAIGIIIAQNRCTQEEASAILKRASNARNVKLRHLAEDIVIQASGGTPTTHFTS
ncbi:ANTAR domain-containing protein [Vibrio cholerae]|nr:ANTAR domain-containing protein [Vibrio cholerae]